MNRESCVCYRAASVHREKVFGAVPEQWGPCGHAPAIDPVPLARPRLRAIAARTRAPGILFRKMPGKTSAEESPTDEAAGKKVNDRDFIVGSKRKRRNIYTLHVILLSRTAVTKMHSVIMK